MPAIERYDGPAFRLLRRFLQKNPGSLADIGIISAEYGLISTDYPLPYYDRQMTKERSQSLNSQVVFSLKTLLNGKSYTDLLIWLGKDYLRAICGYETTIPPQLAVQIATGGIGRKLSILHDWLYRSSSDLQKENASIPPKDKVLIRGIEVSITPEQIFSIARQAIVADERKATRYHSWYVLVDDQRIAPKWLVSQITGLSVSNFATDEARRVLAQLGVEVKRV